MPASLPVPDIQKIGARYNLRASGPKKSMLRVVFSNTDEGIEVNPYASENIFGTGVEKRHPEVAG